MEKQESDLIEQYLDNSLSQEERLSFEKKLNGSSALKEKVRQGQNIIDGIKKARVQELKNMLNSVPVGGPLSSVSGQAALAVLSASVVSLILYFSIRTEKKAYISPPEMEKNPITSHYVSPSKRLDHDEDTATNKPTSRRALASRKSSNSDIEPTHKIISSSTKKPRVDSTPPSPPIVSTNSLDSLHIPTEKPLQHPSNPNQRRYATLLNYQIEVELDSKNKEYDFHYQFFHKKLFLYGPFVENLYELIEDNKEEVPRLYLHYKGAYYYLKKSDSKMPTPVPLVQIASKELIDQLQLGKIR